MAAAEVSEVEGRRVAGNGAVDAPAVLAWVDTCLPVEGLEERLDLASRHELALEVAHDGSLPIATLQRLTVQKKR